MPSYVASREIGPLSYKVEKRGSGYHLWLGGCGIGRPRPDKPADEIWEFSAATLGAAKKEIVIDARERLRRKINKLESDLSDLRDVLAKIKE